MKIFAKPNHTHIKFYYIFLYLWFLFISFAITFGHVQLLSGIILNFSYCSWLHFTVGRTFVRLIGYSEILKFRGIFYSLALKEIFLGASDIKILEHEKCTWKDYCNRGVKLYVLGVHCHIIKPALRLFWCKWVRETSVLF